MLVAIAGTVLFLLAVLVVLCVACSPRVYSAATTHIQFLDMDVPTDRSKWLQWFGERVNHLRTNLDPLGRASGMRTMPAADTEARQPLDALQATMRPVVPRTSESARAFTAPVQAALGEHQPPPVSDVWTHGNYTRVATTHEQPTQQHDFARHVHRD